MKKKLVVIFCLISVFSCVSDGETERKCTELKRDFIKCSYFLNKKIFLEETYFKDSIPVNERIEYYSDGMVKKYTFFDFGGNEMYSAVYDKKGNRTYEKGVLLCYETISQKGIYSNGDTLEHQLFIASPPKTSAKIYGISEAGNYELHTSTVDIYRYVFATVLQKERGEYTVPFVIKYYDSVLNEMFEINKGIDFIVK